MEEIEHKVIITKKGQQIPVQSAEGVTVSVFLPNDDVKEEVKLDVTQEEFVELQERAVTNDIPADILRDKKA